MLCRAHTIQPKIHQDGLLEGVFDDQLFEAGAACDIKI